MRTEKQIYQTIQSQNIRLNHLFLKYEYAANISIKQQAVLELLHIGRIYLRQVTHLFKVMSQAGTIAQTQPSLFTGYNISLFLHVFTHRVNVIRFIGTIDTPMYDRGFKNNRPHIKHALTTFEKQRPSDLYHDGYLHMGEDATIPINEKRLDAVLDAYGCDKAQVQAVYASPIIGLTHTADLFAQCCFASRYIDYHFKGSMSYKEMHPIGLHLYLAVAEITRRPLLIAANELLSATDNYRLQSERLSGKSVVKFNTWWLAEAENYLPTIAVQ